MKKHIVIIFFLTLFFLVACDDQPAQSSASPTGEPTQPALLKVTATEALALKPTSQETPLPTPFPTIPVIPTTILIPTTAVEASVAEYESAPQEDFTPQPIITSTSIVNPLSTNTPLIVEVSTPTLTPLINNSLPFANDWTSIGPEGGIITSLAINPSQSNIVYAGTEGGGVYKSTDGGENWKISNTGLTNPDITALVIDPLTPTTLYAGTKSEFLNFNRRGDIFKSIDGGENWHSFNTGLLNTYVVILSLDPETSSLLYAGTAGDGLFSIQQ